MCVCVCVCVCVCAYASTKCTCSHSHISLWWDSRGPTGDTYVHITLPERPTWRSVYALLIICLPLRETYIVFPSVYVRSSVRPFVCNAFLSEPDSPRTFRAKNLQNIPKITYLLKFCNKKLKFNFAKNFGSFGQKKHFLNLCFVQARSQ